MMRLIGALALVLLSVPSWAMEHHTNVLTDNRGNALKEATVYVYNAGTTTFATIFSDNGTTLKPNPFTTSSAANSPGAYDFYAANGVYDLVFVKAGYSFNNNLTKRIALFDINDGGGGGGGGSAAFGSITSGTNTTAAMIVSTGASLGYTGSGSINASQFRGNTLIPLGDGGTNQTLWTASRCVRVNAGGTGLESAPNDCSISNPAFSTITSATNTTAALVVGTGASLTYSGSGSINASTYKGNATVAVADGGTNLTTAPDDTAIVGNGTTWQARSIPPCSNATTSKLLYDTATNSFSCGTDQSSASATFDGIGSGTNTTATMTVGSGASLTPSGTGVLAATTVRPTVTTINAGNSPYTASATDSLLLCDTAAAARTINLPAATGKLLLGIKNLGSNTCTINRAGADTIDGGTSAVLRSQYEAIWIVTDASASWNIF